MLHKSGVGVSMANASDKYSRERPPPFGLPPGWTCIERQYLTGNYVGRTYTRFSSHNGKHKHLLSVKAVVKQDAIDKGEDPEAALAEYNLKRKINQENFSQVKEEKREANLQQLPTPSPYTTPSNNNNNPQSHVVSGASALSLLSGAAALASGNTYTHTTMTTTMTDGGPGQLASPPIAVREAALLLGRLRRLNPAAGGSGPASQPPDRDRPDGLMTQATIPTREFHPSEHGGRGPEGTGNGLRGWGPDSRGVPNRRELM